MARFGSGHARCDARNTSKGAARSVAACRQYRRDINMKMGISLLTHACQSLPQLDHLFLCFLVAQPGEAKAEREANMGSEYSMYMGCVGASKKPHAFSWSILECIPSANMVRQTQHMGTDSSCPSPPITALHSTAHTRAHTHPYIPTSLSHTRPRVPHAFTSPSSSSTPGR